MRAWISAWDTVKMTSLSRSQDPIGKWVRLGPVSSNVSKSSLEFSGWGRKEGVQTVSPHLTDVLVLYPDGVGGELEPGARQRPVRVTEVRDLLTTRPPVLLPSCAPDLEILFTLGGNKLFYCWRDKIFHLYRSKIFCGYRIFYIYNESRK